MTAFGATNMPATSGQAAAREAKREHTKLADPRNQLNDPPPPIAHGLIAFALEYLPAIAPDFQLDSLMRMFLTELEHWVANETPIAHLELASLWVSRTQDTRPSAADASSPSAVSADASAKNSTKSPRGPNVKHRWAER